MNRRTFIHGAGATGVGLTGPLGLAAPADAVTLLARSLADWPREQMPAELARRIHAGLRQEELLAALALAATHNVQPYPVVGFKYHAVMVLRSVHATAQHLPAADRWLPLIWAADYFKDAQADEKAAGGWRMSQRTASPKAGQQAALRALAAALDRWDHEAADEAIVGCAAFPPEGLFPLLFRQGARDLRDIGHKAISVSNAHSLVTLFGAGPASEALLRSTVAALLNSDGEPDPARADLAPDRPWRVNRERLPQIPPVWQDGRTDPGAQRELRSALYRVSAEDAGGAVVGMLQRGLSPQPIWQTLFDVAAELVVHNPGIVAVHAQTTTHALHHAYRMSGDEESRQLILLQAAAFIAMFRGMVRATGTVDLSALEPLPDARDAPLPGIFADLAAGQRRDAIGRSLGYLDSGGDPDALISQARHHLAYGAEEPHDYKLAEAVFDTQAQFADARWRARYLSAGMAYFKAPAPQPSPLVAETLRLLAPAH